MKTSESIVKLSQALLKAQKNIGAATKGAANPFFKSKYADLGSVMEACKSALNDEGITVLQPVQSTDSGDFVETLLLHESGEYISSSMKLVLSKQDMQAYGSAVSYARRYSLQSLVFIPAEDDDGEKTMTRERPKTQLAERAPAVIPEKFAASVAALTGALTAALVEPSITTDGQPHSDAGAPAAKSRTSFRGGKAKTEESKPLATMLPTATALNF